MQPPQSYSVKGQRSSGQLTGKLAGARPDYRVRWCAVSQGHTGRDCCHLPAKNKTAYCCIHDGKPVTKLAGLIDVESADAQGVHEAIIKALEEMKLNEEQWLEKIVGLNMDGAAVNMGKNSGVAARMAEDIPDAVKSSYLEGKFVDTVKGILKLDQYSPKL
ncbi:UNVERIFIED_CONTAM: hypothetical protein FKN15_040211 [Acipenser sinensis]